MRRDLGKVTESIMVVVFTAMICALLWLAFVYGQHKTEPYRNRPATTSTRP